MVPAVIVLVALAAVCGYLIHDVNTRFPDITVIEQYTKDNPAVENGLQIAPVKYEVYTYEEYRKVFSDNDRYAYLANKERQNTDCRILVFYLRYENVSDKTLVYWADDFQVAGEKSGLSNGVQCQSTPSKNMIAPGEVQEVCVTSFAGVNSQVRRSWIDKLDTDRYALVYWCYPVTKELVFE